MITRKQFMRGEATFDEYYGQWAGKLIPLVADVIGVERIARSEDEHFNDIPLSLWDRMHMAVMSRVGEDIRAANGGGGVSLSDCVCAAKAAARVIRDAARDGSTDGNEEE